VANDSVKREQNRQKELAYIRKVKQTMQPKSTEERQKELAAEQTATKAKHTGFGSAVSNFFYYNKWKVLLITLFGLIAVILVVNLLNKPTYDTQVLTIFSTDAIESEKYADLISKYGYDLDHNGKVETQLIEVCLSEMTETVQRPAMIAYMQLKNVNLYLLDNKIYQELMGVNADAFVDLSALYPDNPNVDGRRFIVEGSEIEKELGVEKLPNKFAFVIRSEDHAQDAKESYQASMKILQNMIENTKTTEE
jgi:hypothetical protein